MLIGKPADIASSEITPRSGYEWYINRRKFLRGAVSGVVTAGAAALGVERAVELIDPHIGAHAGTKLDTVKMTIQVRRKRLRPNLRENQLLAGRTMALETR